MLIAFNALHHLAPLEPALQRLAEAVRPCGWIVVRDFVGPSRFQWTDAQLAAVDALLAEMPERLRRRWGSGSLKRRFYRPGRLLMWLADPSEAAESAQIVPLLDQYFERVAFKPLGGAVLHLLLDDIAHHFAGDDPEARHWLARAVAVEDALLADGTLDSDLVFAVYRKPSPPPGEETRALSNGGA